MNLWRKCLKKYPYDIPKWNAQLFLEFSEQKILLEIENILKENDLYTYQVKHVKGKIRIVLANVSKMQAWEVQDILRAILNTLIIPLPTIKKLSETTDAKAVMLLSFCRYDRFPAFVFDSEMIKALEYAGIELHILSRRG